MGPDRGFFHGATPVWPRELLAAMNSGIRVSGAASMGLTSNRHRRHYDMRATFITLAIEDGADPDVLETRVTHTRKARNAFDGYNRGQHWERTCAEISKLRIARGPRSSAFEQTIAAGRGPDSLQFAAVLASSENGEGRSWRRRESKSTGTPTKPSACCMIKSLAS
jgi:hypothetical protein